MLINAAVNTWAASYLLGVVLLALIILGSAGYFVGRSLLRRFKTLFWTPAVGDVVYHRKTRLQGTVEKIDESGMRIGYYTPNNIPKNYWNGVVLGDVFFMRRPVSLKR